MAGTSGPILPQHFDVHGMIAEPDHLMVVSCQVLYLTLHHALTDVFTSSPGPSHDKSACVGEGRMLHYA
jgi:hypothetical protein